MFRQHHQEECGDLLAEGSQKMWVLFDSIPFSRTMFALLEARDACWRDITHALNPEP